MWYSPGESPYKQFDHFLEYVATDGNYLRGQVESVLANTPLIGKVQNVIEEARHSFVVACEHWKKEYAGLCTAWKSAVSDGRRNSVLNAIHYQARSLWRTETIAALAEKRFLPRYGFPINVQALTVQSDGAEEPVQFQRSSMLALSEYVPGSVLLGGARSYASHGVLSFWSDTGERNFGVKKYLYTCINGHQWKELQPLEEESCPHCGGLLARSETEL
jgi:hypothetical protein